MPDPVTAIIGSAVIGAGSSVIGSSNAASAQREASNNSNALQQGMFNTTQANIRPYLDVGNSAAGFMKDALPGFTQPISFNQHDLDNAPGFQWQKEQGLKAVQNSAAARGLGLSGAAMKGAATFANGLANSTYKDFFNMENINRTNAYNRLFGVAGLGANAAVGQGTLSNQAAANMGNNITGAGNAQAAAWMNGSNAVGNAANNIGQGYMFNSLMNGRGGGGGGGFYPYGSQDGYFGPLGLNL